MLMAYWWQVAQTLMFSGASQALHTQTVNERNLTH